MRKEHLKMVNRLGDRRKKETSLQLEWVEKKLVVSERIKCTYNVKRNMFEEVWLFLPREDKARQLSSKTI